MALLQGVLERLGVVVFERTDQGDFRLCSRPPRWLNVLTRQVGAAELASGETISLDTLCDVFPVVDSFMHDAAAVWAQNDSFDSGLRSGLWTDIDENANEYNLEARAMRLDGAAVLLIENLSDTFSDRHQVYQKARDIALINEKLVSELNYRQRKLQSEIVRHLACESTVNELPEAVERNTSAVLVCLPDGHVEVYNKALIDIYEMKVEDQIVRASLLDKWISEAEQNYPEIHRVLRSGAYWEGEFKTKGSRNEDKWIRLSIGPVKDSEGSIAHYVCVANDLTDYQRSSEDWHRVAEYDFNTHLPNRRQFWKHISSAFEANAGAEEMVGLLYIDIDYFKRINDDFGQMAGDFLLSTIASRISRNIKYRDFVAHLGGDEFAIVLRFLDSEEVTANLSDRLLNSISEPLSLDGHPISVTASIGCAVERIKDTDPRSLLRKADLAMYAAKELGRSQARMYSKAMEDHLPMRRQREHELSEAIERQQFVLEFQPQVAIRSEKGGNKCRGNVFRVEALIRWMHPDKGMIAPSGFIAIAEESGSIVHIGKWVLSEACEQGVRMMREGVDLNMAVNISPKQLRHPDFYNCLTTVLESSGFPPERLELEITESNFLKEMEAMIALLGRIRERGIMIALDDFGSGFSSLNYLKRLPVNCIKIDRSFVRDLPNDIESKAITTSVIHLAHQLDMEVIAEGVETRQQMDFLKKQQVDYIQGFYFHRPMSADKILALMREDS
ncbi:MAG: hypothetical protein C9356_10010 [Oleiphilus sp.]|nr:MAG: hypothetical protein C9356_10010 [Oleiphilus sp.]